MVNSVHKRTKAEGERGRKKTFECLARWWYNFVWREKRKRLKVRVSQWLMTWLESMVICNTDKQREHKKGMNHQGESFTIWHLWLTQFSDDIGESTDSDDHRVRREEGRTQEEERERRIKCPPSGNFWCALCIGHTCQCTHECTFTIEQCSVCVWVGEAGAQCTLH